MYGAGFCRLRQSWGWWRWESAISSDGSADPPAFFYEEVNEKSVLTELARLREAVG